MIILYNTILFLLIIIGLPILLPVGFLSENRRKTVWRRLGFAQPFPKKTGTGNFSGHHKPIWVHALSVGEALSAAPLLSGLKEKFPAHPLLLTVSTLTGYQIAQKKLRGLATSIRFFPYDIPFCVKQAIHRIDPALVLIVETDVWPNFMFEIQKRKIPTLLVNARLSVQSYQGYRRLSFFFRPLFSAFSRICVQSETDARRFAGLGIAPDKIHPTGNLKFDQNHAALSPDTLAKHRQSLSIGPGQPVIVAGSTHDGEEKILLRGIRRLKRQWPTLTLVIAPRDPKRAASVSLMAESMNLRTTTMTARQKSSPGPPPDVVVVNILGILRDLYALADIAFVGGTLVPHSGHNPLEPAAWAKPILFGPDMRDFLTISHSLETAGGAMRIHDTDSFSRVTNRLLSDPRKSAAMGQNALAVFQANGGAVEKTLAVTADYL